MDNSDNLEKKFYTQLVAESYKTTDVNLISKRIKDTINVDVSPERVREILIEDYELESRKMAYSISIGDIFY